MQDYDGPMRRLSSSRLVAVLRLESRQETVAVTTGLWWGQTSHGSASARGGLVDDCRLNP